MPKRSFVQIDGKLYEKGVDDIPQRHEIMPDIQPYRSMITGELIESRSKHREHLARHGYEEVGNDSSLFQPRKGIPDANPEQRRELIRSQVDRLTHRELQAVHKRFVDNWKWNSREN